MQPTPSGAPIAPSDAMSGPAPTPIESPADTPKRKTGTLKEKLKNKKAKKKEEEERRRLAEEHQGVKAAAAELDAAVKNVPLTDNEKASSTNLLRNPGEPGTGTFTSLKHTHDAKAPSSRFDRGVPADSPIMIERRVELLLNKLIPARLGLTLVKLVETVNASEHEKDGRTLIQVIRLIFETATNDMARSRICARLCRKMMERISPAVSDDNVHNAEGQPIAGGHLFRRHLLDRCQEDFKRGWMSHAQDAVPAAENTADGDQVLHSDRRYDEKAKRQGLGLVQFIGELFKVQMLSERIMHECIKQFLSKLDVPGEEEIESLCLLLTTIGQKLDTKNARAYMNVYFLRLKELSVDDNVDVRLRSMIVEVIELRSRNWSSRDSPSNSKRTTTMTQDQATAEEFELGNGEADMRRLAHSGLMGSDSVNDNDATAMAAHSAAEYCDCLLHRAG